MCAWFCIDSSSIFFRCLFVSLSRFLRYHIRILPVCSQVFTGSSISPLCASGFVHPQVVPLIISPHLLNVPFLVSWLNIIIYNRTFTVIDNTNTISKLHLENLLSIFVDFPPILLLFSFHVCLVFCRFFDRIIFILSRVFTGSCTSPLCASGLVHPQVVPLIASSHLLYHD